MRQEAGDSSRWGTFFILNYFFKFASDKRSQKLKADSYLDQYCIHLHNFTIYEYLTSSRYDQLQVGLIAQLVEHCTGMGSNPCSNLNNFQGYVSYITAIFELRHTISFTVVGPTYRRGLSEDEDDLRFWIHWLHAQGKCTQHCCWRFQSKRNSQVCQLPRQENSEILCPSMLICL